VGAAGEVLVEGHYVGTLDGFRFAPDPGVAARASDGRGGRDAGRSVRAAALRALGGPIRRRIEQLEGDEDDAFALSADGGIDWRGAPVGRLRAGADALSPRVEPLASDLLEADGMARLRARLERFVRFRLRALLGPLFAVEDPRFSGAARGLLYQVSEALGALPRRRAAAQVNALSRDDRTMLAGLGLCFGRESVYFPRLLRAKPMALRALLWSLDAGRSPVPAPPFGRPSFLREADVPDAFYAASGYRLLGPRAVRIDILERLAMQAGRLARREVVVVETDLAGLVSCGRGDVAALLAALGYRLEPGEEGPRLRPDPRRRGRDRGDRSSAARPAGDREVHSPFAVLSELRKVR